MLTRICLPLLALSIFASSAGAHPLEFAGIGRVEIVDPKNAPAGIVILFTDRAETEPALRESVQALVEAGQVVVEVNTNRLLSSIDGPESRCMRVADALAALKSMLFQRQSLAENTTVVLAGAGPGAAMAYAVLAQSEAGQFSGAVSFGFNPELPGPRPLCVGAPYEKTPNGFRYLPSKRLNGFWRIATTTPEDEKLRPYVHNRKDVLFPLRPYDDLASTVIGVLADATRPVQVMGPKIEDLPLVTLPVDRHGNTMAVIYSGDGGWRDLDKQIGEQLQKAGVPVVGVDTLRAFWHRQTPEAAAKDLERIVDHFTKAWGTPDVLLLGYSFGADIIPFMANRITPGTLDKIRLISLLGLSRTAEFEIHMRGWLGDSPSTDALALAPELRKLDPRRVQCFFGTEEQDQSGCTDASLAGAEIIKTAGGHHFDGDYGRIVRAIIEAAIRRGAGLKPGGG